MSTDVVKESIAPLVQRILADPLHFVTAKRQEHQANKPQSYVKIGVTHSKEQRPTLEQPAPEATETKMVKKRPSSLAAALAGYTGKRVFSAEDDAKKTKKARINHTPKSESSSTISVEPELDFGESLEDGESTADSQDSTAEEEDDDEEEHSIESSKIAFPLDEDKAHEVSSDSDEPYTDAASPEFVSETPHNIISKKVFEQFKSSSSSDDNSEEESKSEEAINEDDDDEDDEDDDYVEGQTNESIASDKSTGNSDESSSDEKSIDEDDDDEADSDIDLLKADLLKNKSQPSPTDAATPPTSPESEDALDEEDEKSLPNSANKLDNFFQFNEAANDRGSNKSKRILKNWGTQLSALKPSGLLNHGVTCYTNAAVQAMVHIPAVQHYLNDVLNNKYKDSISPRSVTHVLAETASRMWKSDKGNKYINPKKLIGRLDDINCMMSEWQQEDSHEYFMSLLSRLQEDSTPKGHKLNESIIYDIFGGLLNQSVTCKNCGHVSKTQQEFYDLSLHLGSSRKNSITALSEQDKKLLDQNGTQIPQSPLQADDQESKQRYSIQKSIKDFFSPELIKPDRSDKSGYVCEKCKQRTSAIKISSIDRAPETLAVHLKRFRFNGSSSSKVKQGVSYPLILDLSHYTTRDEPVLYQLISVVVHEGRSVSSGHYIAHCRQPDGSWATYDDEYINSITEKQALCDPSAYYLIYTRLTHKDLIPNPTNITKFITNNDTPEHSHKRQLVAPKKQQPPSSPASQQKPSAKQQHNTIGIMTPKSPISSPSNSLKPFKKQKIGSIVPTNNLGNASVKNKRYASKNGNRNSKRFKRY